MEIFQTFNIEENDLDKPIWRYLDFSKFVALLENKSLFFSKVNFFEDKFEGIHNAITKDDHYDITNDGEIIRIPYPIDERAQNNSEDYKKYISKNLDLLKASVGINCWRFNQNDSHAMWRIFLNSDEGVAIKTSINSLKKSLPNLPDFQKLHLGKVKYIDYKNEKIPLDNMFNSFFYKNIYFDHESELRILHYHVKNEYHGTFYNNNLKPIESSGITLNINPEILIHEIILSPYASDWFSNLVKDLSSKKYNLKIPVKNSVIELKK